MEHDLNEEKSAMRILVLLRLIDEIESLRSSERTLLQCLVLHTDRKMNIACDPSYADLQRWTKLCDETLRLAAAKLEAKGFIRRVIRPHRTNLFYVQVERIFAEVAKTRKVETGAENTTLLSISV